MIRHNPTITTHKISLTVGHGASAGRTRALPHIARSEDHAISVGRLAYSSATVTTARFMDGAVQTNPPVMGVRPRRRLSPSLLSGAVDHWVRRLGVSSSPRGTVLRT